MTPADVLIEGERILPVGTGFGDPDAVIDAAGETTRRAWQREPAR